MSERVPLHSLSGRLRLAAVVASVVLLSVLHVASPQPHGRHDMDAHGLHSALEGLYYLPILMAGVWWGLRAGAVTGGTVSLVYGIHTHLQLGGVLDPVNRGRLLALVLFPVIGAVTGLIADRLRRESSSLVEAERQLRRADTLAALGELSAGLAHEIRNPLAAIRGAAEVLASGVPKDGRDAEFASMLISEVDRLDSVLGEFLSFARPGTRGRAHTDPVDDARATLQLLERQAVSRSVTMHLAAGDGIPRVQCPPESLRQVLLNVCLNALHALDGREGGRLTVRLDRSGDGRVAIQVDDNGPGVPAEDRERIFRPFVTGRDSGTGLGLSVVAKILEGAAGSISVEEAPGGGARFAILLPEATTAPPVEIPEIVQ